MASKFEGKHKFQKLKTKFSGKYFNLGAIKISGNFKNMT
jgi:hypothetical protein